MDYLVQFLLIIQLKSLIEGYLYHSLMYPFPSTFRFYYQALRRNGKRIQSK